MGGLGLLLINVSEVIRLEMAYTVALHQAKVKDIHLPVWSPIYSLDLLYIPHLMLIQSSQSSHEPWNIRDAQRKVTGSTDSNSNWPDSKDSWVSEWVKVAQLCPTLCNPMDYTVHEILQARILEWVAFPFSRGSSQPRDRTQVSHIAGGFFTSWATREAMLTH